MQGRVRAQLRATPVETELLYYVQLNLIIHFIIFLDQLFSDIRSSWSSFKIREVLSVMLLNNNHIMFYILIFSL